MNQIVTLGSFQQSSAETNDVAARLAQVHKWTPLAPSSCSYAAIGAGGAGAQQLKPDSTSPFKLDSGNASGGGGGGGGAALVAGAAKIDSTPFLHIVRRTQAHLKTCIATVVDDQRSLADRVVTLEEYSTKLSNTISNRKYHAKIHLDQLNSLQSLSTLSDKISTQMTGILDAIETINALLIPPTSPTRSSSLPPSSTLNSSSSSPIHPMNRSHPMKLESLSKTYPLLTKLINRRRAARIKKSGSAISTSSSATASPFL